MSRAHTTTLRIAQRVGGALLIVWGAATAGFIALKLIPGDPVEVMLGVQSQVSDSVKAAIRAEWGLNDPVIVQYFSYLGRLATGDLGRSYQLRQPVADVITSQLGATAALTGLAIAMALVISLATALAARGRWAAAIASIVELILVSSPTFWIGLVLIAVFGFGLHWFPVTSTQGFAALVLPAVTLALPISGILSQVLRQGLETAETQPFVLTARARGLSHARLVANHTLRHAAGDGITLSGYILGSLLGGAVLVETVFGRAGLGRVTLRAVIDRDLPVVLGIIVVIACAFAVINLLVDLAHERLDPRLRARVAGISSERAS
ncbi:MAG: ABC transporter permease [Microbacteriaceae bacterium]